MMSTSDGISAQDWAHVREFAEQIVELTSQDVDASLRVTSLLEFLDVLEENYGRLPSILATRADYVATDTEKLSLLKEGYVLADEIGDHKNRAYISCDIAEYYSNETDDQHKTKYWVAQLRSNLKGHKDPFLERQLNELAGSVDSANIDIE